MQDNLEQPFIVYSIHSPTFAVSLFGHSPNRDIDSDEEIPAAAVVLSGGIHRRCGGYDEAIPWGLLGSDDIGNRFANLLISKLVNGDDSVVLIIDKANSRSDHQYIMQKSLIEVFDAKDFLTIHARGETLSNLYWMRDVYGATETYALAWRQAGSDFENEILDYAKRGVYPTIPIGRYWRAINDDPLAGHALLGEYRLFAYLGGFDLHDMIIQFKEMDENIIRDSATQTAKELGIALYEGSTSDKGESFWYEGGTWRQIPDDWARIDDSIDT